MGCCQSAAEQHTASTVMDGDPTHRIQRTLSGNAHELIVKPGHLLFEVCISTICTRNLEAVDLLSSDPFVRFKWGETIVHETRHFDKRAVKCRYPETFGFYYSTVLDSLSLQKLFVEVYDYNRSGKHQLIGSAEISLKSIATGPIHHDHQLISTHRNKPAPCGRVSFNCTMQCTDVWKLTFNGYRIVYKKTALEETHGLPFKVRYNFVDKESNIEKAMEGTSMERPRKAFGSLKVLTFTKDKLPPLRWTGSFLKFISGSLQIQLVCVEPTGLSFHGSDIMTGHEQQFGQVWLPLKKLYSASTMLPDIKRSKYNNKKEDHNNKATAALSSDGRSSSRSSSSDSYSDDRPSLSSSNHQRDDSAYMSERGLSHEQSGEGGGRGGGGGGGGVQGVRSEYMRRQSEFDNDLWLMGQKIGSIAGSIIFERVPRLGQMASGVLTESGVAAASPVIVGEAVGGTIFRFLHTKSGPENLPKRVNEIGQLFAKLSSIGVAKKQGEKKQKKCMRQLLIQLRESDKFSMVSFTYSGSISLFNSQKMFLTGKFWYYYFFVKIELLCTVVVYQSNI